MEKGITIDALGRIRWTPMTGDITTVPFPITVTVTDMLGATATQRINLNVVPDDQAPQISLTSNLTGQIAPGTPVTFRAVATDNVAVAGVQLLVNGQAVLLDAFGMATVTLNQGGAVDVRAIALDTTGNRRETSLPADALIVAPPNNTAPIISLNLSGIANRTITAATDILGSIADAEGDRVSYQLQAAAIDSDTFQTLFTGNLERNGAINNQSIGKFDPSLLQNDTYRLRLIATDEYGSAAIVEDTLSVAGELKLGNFRLSFTDLAIPVTGIPITLTRTYDTLTTGTSDDFGYGWRMEFRDTDLKTSLRRTAEQEVLGTYPGFTNGTRVYITLPGGKREGFTFRPVGSRFNAFFGAAPEAALYTPSFVGDKGVTSTLTVRNAAGTYLNFNGKEYVGLNGRGFNPADSLFGSVYVLTTKEGVEYEIDAVSGDLLTVTDRNGNKLTYTDGGIFSSTGKQVTFERDAAGRIVSVKDPIGELIRYEYDSEGNLVKVRDQEGQITEFVYDADRHLPGFRPHYLEQVIDPLGRTGAKAVYGQDGRLREIVNAAGQEIEMEYDPANSRQIVRDNLGNPTFYEYDDRGNVVKVTNALGHSSSFQYDANNNLIQAKDANNLVTKYTYDDRGNLTSKTEAYCGCASVMPGTTYYNYNVFGQMTSLVLPTGASMFMDYDNRGNLLDMRDGKGSVIQTFTYYANGLVKSETDSTGTTTYEYDGFGNVSRSIDANGITQMQYNANGLLTWMREDNGTPNDSSDDQVSTFLYDKLGREEFADYGNGIWVDYDYTLPDSSQKTPGGDWTRLTAPTIGTIERRFTEDGKLAGWVTADGGTPTFRYDAAGRLWQETDASGRTTTEYGYDAAGRLTTVRDVRTGATTLRQYDPGNRLVEEINPLGAFTRNVYNARTGRVDRVERGQYLLNAAGELMRDGAGNPVLDTRVTVRVWTYSYEGNQTTVTDPLGRKTTSVQDDYSLPIETVIQGATGTYRTSTEYLYSNNLQEAKDYPTRVVDIGGNDRYFTYDNFGRLRTATDLGDAVYTYDYGDNGLSKITGPTGETLEYRYDDVLGNLTRVIYGDGTSKQMSYRPTDNRLGMVTLPSGETITTDYFASGQVKSQITRDAAGGVTASVSYTYTTEGNVKTMTDGTGTTTYHYDPNTNALSGIDSPNGSSIRYGHDLLGRVNRITEKASANGTEYTTRYEYDAFGNLAKVIDPSGGETTMRYDAANRLLERRLPNGVTTTYSYHQTLDWILSMTHTNAQGEVLASVTYERTGIGQPSKITREDGSFVTLKYDAALRVTEESYYNPDGTLQETITSTYDSAGKRTSRTDKFGTDIYAYQPGYQLDSITGADGNEDYDFDTNGRLTLIDRGGQRIDLEHDAGDRLTQVENETTGTTIGYQYDGSGNRVRATSGSATRQFLVAPSMGGGLQSTDLIADGNGNLLSNYVYAGGHTPFMRIDANGNPIYYLTDAMGSVIGLADGAGREAGDFRYDSFGNLRGLTNTPSLIDSMGGDFRFQGQWLESETGIYHFRARDYDAQTGTFLSRDPIDIIETEPESFNPYQFVYNNPQVYSDPSGEITLNELITTQKVQQILNSIPRIVLNEARDAAMDKARGVVTDVVLSSLKSLTPTAAFTDAINSGTRIGNLRAGTEFGEMLQGAICSVIGGSYTQFTDSLWFEAQLNNNTGRPVHDGYRCGEDIPAAGDFFRQRIFNTRPDLIIKQGGPATTVNRPKAYMLGDFKLSANYVNDVVTNNTNQHRRFVMHARNHQFTPVIVYMTLFGTSDAQLQEIRQTALTRDRAMVFTLSLPWR